MYRYILRLHFLSLFINFYFIYLFGTKLSVNRLISVRRNGKTRLCIPFTSGAGQAKLHRRSLLSPQMAPERRPANENSSSRVSLDKPERGKEADDDPFSLARASRPSRRHRKRHRRINRDDSISFSDSEVLERRHRIKDRTNAVCWGSSVADDILSPEMNEMSTDLKSPDCAESIGVTSKLSADDSRLSSKNWGSMSKSDFSELPLRKQNIPDLKNFTSTSESVESTYKGFGVSKPNRSELLSHINAFQKLCPAKEEDTENTTVLTQQSLQCDENDVTSDKDLNFVSADDNSGLNTNIDVENECEPVVAWSRKRLWAVSSSGSRNLTSRSLCDTLDYADHLDTDTVGDSLVTYGDVVTIDADEEERAPMTVRLAGAGLRCGTVGTNNTFQVTSTY